MTKMVKILLGSSWNYYDDYSDCNYTNQNLIGIITDWEEISDEDYQFLKSNIHRMFNDKIKSDNSDVELYPFLVVKDTVPVVERIASLKHEIQKIREKEASEKKRKEEEKQKRQANKLLRDRAKALQLYEQLKSEFENNNL